MNMKILRVLKRLIKFVMKNIKFKKKLLIYRFRQKQLHKVIKRLKKHLKNYKISFYFIDNQYLNHFLIFYNNFQNNNRFKILKKVANQH